MHVPLIHQRLSPPALTRTSFGCDTVLFEDQLCDCPFCNLLIALAKSPFTGTTGSHFAALQRTHRATGVHWVHINRHFVANN